jgi:hypothetical protein
VTSSVPIRYRDSDPAMARPESFLSRLVTEAVGGPVEIVSDSRARVDLQFTSVQVPLVRRMTDQGRRIVETRLPRRKSARDKRWSRENPQPVGEAGAHIWFTGENVRPPVGSWDGYLTYDLDPLGGRNSYLPLWWHSVGLLGSSSSIFTSNMPSCEQLAAPRDTGAPRPKFACAFINNPEPIRLHAIRALAAVGDVDVFGRSTGRPIPDKAAVARDYRFVLCFENDVYPGYVTEKPLEAWATGAVPLWRGSDPAGYLNPLAMINAVDYPSLADFVDAAAEVDRSPDAWSAMAAQPIITRRPDLRPATDLIRRSLGLS